MKNYVSIIAIVMTSILVYGQSPDNNPVTRAGSSSQGELLYNGIRLPKEWPPMTPITDRSVRPVPYLINPPAVIPIDVGRQLFVDDFLIEKTTLNRQFHYPEHYKENPILKPETPIEMDGGNSPMAAPFNDGVWFDPKDQLFKMWYKPGWHDGTAYATSHDGLTWERPKLDIVPDTNLIFPKQGHGQRDGDTVWLDSVTTDPNQRFKMYVYERPSETYGGRIFASADGIHWNDQGRVHVGASWADNTTVFYNPFRRKWVYSIRLYRFGRARDYWECDALAKPGQGNPSPWAGADVLDLPDPGVLALMPTAEEIKKEAAASTNETVAQLTTHYRSIYGDPTQLYNLDAIPYESLMLGVFDILRGPTTSKGWNKYKMPKINDLEFAYSRDGFHWDRPDRTPFLASARKEGVWDRGYLHPASSICAVVGDKLYFYYSGWSGQSPKLGTSTYAGGSTGVAFLRRDGFASMDAIANSGQLTTRLVMFKGKYLFINLDAPKGELRAEVLDQQGKVIAPFSMDNCLPVSGDSTRQEVTWKGTENLSALSGRQVKFRFQLRQGQLYAFWVTPDAKGASYGYVAAGGPGFSGAMDKGTGE